MQYEQLYQAMGYVFNDQALCERALVHRSASRDSNERLEFLGDSILGFIMAHELYGRYPEMTEGELSRLRSSLVNGDTLAEVALDLTFNDYLCLGQGEQRSGGHQRPSILADALEAMIAAIYLDGGLELCRDAVLRWFAPRLAQCGTAKATKDAKSTLQEWTQSQKMPLPQYDIVKVEGRAHEQTFEVSCCVEGLEYKTMGVSSSRRKAEQIAAAKFLEQIDE